MKKFLPYIFILLILVGTFMPFTNVDAQTEVKYGSCFFKASLRADGSEAVPAYTKHNSPQGNCASAKGIWNMYPPDGAKNPNLGIDVCLPDDAVCLNARGPASTSNIPCDGGTNPITGERTPAGCNPNLAAGTGNALWDQMSCGFTNIVGCFLYIAYALFVALPSFLLGFVAIFFNFMVSITLSSEMYDAPFIAKIWKVIRDFGNIFFILILLYAAFQTILGLGHGGAKKVIVSVIAIALVVNFSLFFTKVVVDAGNVLGLVFYNKIATTQVKAEPQIGTRASVPQKNIAGAFASNFNPNAFFSEKTFNELDAYGKKYGTGNGVNNYVLISMIMIYGIVIYVMVYALTVVGLSLLGRTLMLMSLMVVAPFAFVSYAIPPFKKIDTIGFDSWIHKLMDSSFVAAVMVFILYLISEVLKADVFGSAKEGDGILATLVVTFLPGILIAMLLLKGASYAKKASGEFTGAVISGAKVTAGLVVGGAALGSAALLRGTAGAFMKGASTGDTAAARTQGPNAAPAAAARRANLRAELANPNLTFVERSHLRKQLLSEHKDNIKGAIQARLGIQTAQTWVGERLNQDQHNIRHAAHARHDLDTAASDITHGEKKKWDDLNGEERYEATRKIERDRVVRDNSGAGGNVGDPNYLAGMAFQSRKWDSLTPAEKEAVDNLIGVETAGPHAGQAVAGGRLALHESHAEQALVPAARVKQGLVSNVVQSTVTGTYDPRGLAKIIAKEQSTAMAKLTMGLTGAIAMGMRGGFKQMGVNYGEPQRAFFKDLGNTIGEALKGIKVNVDLSHVGEEKKEDHKGGGHH